MSNPTDIKSIPGHIFRKTGNAFYRIATYVDSFLAPRNPHLIRWVADRGDKTLRLNYDLTKESVVFDLGGYEGQWTSDIYAMYACKIHAFEAIPEFAHNLQQRFSQNSDIQAYVFGLGDAAQTINFYLDRDGSSMIRTFGQSVEAQIVRADDFLQAGNFQFIDLIKINIEGAEYALLEHLIETGWVEKIGNIQVQFHDFFPEARARMHQIQSKLRQSHELTYQYEFVWENWAKK